VAVSSGGAALMVAMKALGVGPGDEVVVPAFTFPAAAQAALWLHAVPVPADVDESTLAANAATVRGRLTPRTRAVVVAHAFGIPADVEEVVEIAGRSGVPVVEDAACSLGGRTPTGLQSGTAAAAGCFSLHPRKSATSGEGGLIAATSPLAAEVRRLRDYGRTGSGFGDVFGATGVNFRLSDLGAAVARVQVGRVDDSIARRGALVARYRERLQGVAGVSVPAGYDRPGQTWQTFAVRVADGRATVAALAARGIQAGPAAHDLCGQAFWRDRAGAAPGCPVSAALAATLVALPLFDELTEAEVERVCDALATAA
jgi:dTDP-4-amino-4,6-dideoxygalactose transaminase